MNRLERVLAAEGRRGEALSGEFAGLFKLKIGDIRVISGLLTWAAKTLEFAHVRLRNA